MATTTALPGVTAAEPLKHVDINHLSQSELLNLSFTSDSASHLRRTAADDDVVSPQLDRSLFNESAGSRRQTYSRIHHHRSHSRLHHPSSLKPHRPHHPSSDPVTHSIVHFFKHFLNGNHNPPPPPPPPPPPEPEVLAPPVAELGFLGLREENFKMKRKRMRKTRVSSKKRALEDIELLRVNARGELVDFEKLEGTGDALYTGELKRRTLGLETEEAVLGFLGDLEGQWCSRRMRRKYVDAALFGDVLPTGWKLLLGLRRRDFRVSIYCRRYISPTGQHFVSCKEAASFLKVYFGDNDVDHERDQKTRSIQQAYVVSSEKITLPAGKMNAMVHDVAPDSKPSNLLGNDGCLMDIENLPEVQVHDVFECSKCNLTFGEKDEYVQHLFSFHQKTTKRYKLGTPVGEGVIIRDGKFECQFCHKVFEERRSYNGHVGIHVRNAGKFSSEISIPVNVHKKAESPLQETLPLSASKNDVLIEIEQGPAVETSNSGNSEQAVINQQANVLKESVTACSEHEANLSSDPIEIQKEDFNADGAQHLSPSSQVIMENKDMVSNAYQWDVDDNMETNCFNDSEHVGASDVEKTRISNLEMGLENSDRLEETPELTVEDIDGGSSVPMAQSFQFFPSFDSASNKVGHEFSVVDQKLQNVSAFEELRFDDLEPFKYGFVNEQELQSIPGCSMNLGNDSRIEDGFNSSIQFGSEEVMLNSMDDNQLTVCVWCRTEFKLEGIESETPSDSIGYMCPTCKAKISGHFGGGLSLDPRGF